MRNRRMDDRAVTAIRASIDAIEGEVRHPGCRSERLPWLMSYGHIMRHNQSIRIG